MTKMSLLKDKSVLKICSVEVIPETVFEMPDESDLISVFSMPSDAEHQTVRVLQRSRGGGRT